MQASVSKGRRPPGQVRDAIIEALSRRGKTASVGEIHKDVEELLAGDVPRSSVRSYLQLGTEAGHFTNVARGRYRIASGRR